MPPRATMKTTVDDRVWRALKRKLPGIGRVKVKVGVVGSLAQADHGGITNATLMAIHEFGAPRARIPARKPIRKTFDTKVDELRGLQRRLCKALLDGNMTVERAVALMGLWGANAIKATIRKGLTPPLKPATIARKGSSKPLVDTGQLLNAISWMPER